MADVNHKSNKGHRSLVVCAAVLAALLVGCGTSPEANPLMTDGTVPPAADAQVSADTSGSDTGAADAGGAEQPTPPDAGQPAPGDMDGNGVVDQTDENNYRISFQTAFGSSAGGANYDPSLDMNGDNVIGWSDLQAFLAIVGG